MYKYHRSLFDVCLWVTFLGVRGISFEPKGWVKNHPTWVIFIYGDLAVELVPHKYTSAMKVPSSSSSSR